MATSRIPLLWICFFLYTSLGAQTAQTAPAPIKPNPSATATKEDTHISPAEADELFKSLNDVMKFASDDSGLPLHSPIKHELGNRDQVVEYIQKKLEDDEDTKRFEASELVLKKFGMLPVDFQLKPFMLKLLREQVAGFYDAKTKTMHLLDWLPADAQRPVMAHELTHALQDQTVDLENWADERSSVAKKAADPINAGIRADEDSTARTALLEGQGMAVMVDYMLAPVGRTVENSPDMVNMMKDAMSGSEEMTVLASAPILLKESLTFPYREGLGFVQALLKAGGKKLAFAGALKDPPQDSHQILHPQDYLDKKTEPVMKMPDLKAVLGDKYEKYDVGAIGEFDLVVLFKQFADDRSVKELAPAWRGGMYYAASKHGKDAKGVATPSLNDVAVLYVSHWPSADLAKQFATAYGLTVTKRYAPATARPCAGIADCSVWNTSGDPVYVQALGDSVIVMESFDEKAASALRKLFQVNLEHKPQMETQVTAANLSLRVVAPFFAAQRLLLP